MGVSWLLAAIGVLQFLSQLEDLSIDFDGLHWYLVDKVGTVSVRFDGQVCMLLRFEDDLTRASWLWVEARKSDQQDSEHWQALRRAVYSRASANNLPNLL